MRQTQSQERRTDLSLGGRGQGQCGSVSTGRRMTVTSSVPIMEEEGHLEVLEETLWRAGFKWAFKSVKGQTRGFFFFFF